jgi:glycosidase
MIAFLLAYPGSPMIYYGEEMGLDGAFAEDGRRPFPWGGGDTSTQEFFRHALMFRRESVALRLGDYTRVYLDEATRSYAFVRRAGSETICAVFNAGDTPADLVIPVNDTSALQWHDALGLNPDAANNNGGLFIRMAPRTAAWYVSGS